MCNGNFITWPYWNVKSVMVILLLKCIGMYDFCLTYFSVAEIQLKSTAKIYQVKIAQCM